MAIISHPTTGSILSVHDAACYRMACGFSILCVCIVALVMRTSQDRHNVSRQPR